jgi:hypothetical protein
MNYHVFNTPLVCLICPPIPPFSVDGVDGGASPRGGGTPSLAEHRRPRGPSAHTGGREANAATQQLRELRTQRDMDGSPSPAAAAADAAPPPCRPPPAGERGKVMRGQHHLTPWTHCAYDVSVCGVHGNTESVAAPPGMCPRCDTDGQPICELCPVRLSRAKGKLHKHGAGHICANCYNRKRGLVGGGSVSAAAVSPSAPKKRRVQSDPGQQREAAPPQAVVLHAQSIETAVAHTQSRVTRQQGNIMRLLDETHARRMVYLASAAEATDPEPPSAAPPQSC